MAAQTPPCEEGQPTEIRSKRIARYRSITIVYCRRCRRWRPSAGWTGYTLEIREALSHNGWRPWSEVIRLG